MPPLETTEVPRRRRRGQLVAAVSTLALTALVGITVGTGPAAAKQSAPAPKPVQLSVLSPGSDDIAGRDGAGFVVDLALTARNKNGNSLLSPESGYKPFFNNPTAPTFVPGPNGGAPGLVVLLSTTPDTPGTPFHGPNTNLAGLFQINGVGAVRGGLTQTWNTWQIGKAGFGSGSSTLTAYVVKGTAPAMAPASGLELISNTVKVPFTIAVPGTATPTTTPSAAANATLKTLKDPRLGDVVADTNGRTVYMFERDQGTTTACTGACAATWPALPTNGILTAGTGLDPSKIGSAHSQVTYAGHLLYFYAGDGKPGDTIGAGVPGWDAISPTGAPMHAG